MDEFDLTDVLSPTATIGMSWGRQIPVVLGITGGWSPGYDAFENQGAMNIGLTIAAYVPIIDFN